MAGKTLALISFKYAGISSKFSLRFFDKLYLFACKCISHAKHEKKPM